jgi:PPM family protein phosphatase
MFWKKWVTDNATETTNNESSDFRAVVVTDVGCVRTNNEDAARFIRPAQASVRSDKGFLAIVADGMGGHAAGEVASQLAIETITKTYYQQEDAAEASLYVAFSKANRAIWQAAARNSRQKGMGTTCTAVALSGHALLLMHVGDSRAYLYKNGQLTQLTTDHTYVQQLVDEGVISPGDADKHPERNVLTRAMGTHQKVEVDIVKTLPAFENSNRLMLCSDGLHDYLSRDELATLLNVTLLNEAAQAMVELAKQRGGHDNITVLLVERVSPDEWGAAKPTQIVEPS